MVFFFIIDNWVLFGLFIFISMFVDDKVLFMLLIMVVLVFLYLLLR